MTYILQNYMKNLINLNPYWITGFADGESTFGVTSVGSYSTHKLGYQVRVWFAISQDQRDLEILESSFSRKLCWYYIQGHWR